MLSSDIYLGGARCTLNPNIEAVNFKIKLANNKFILVANVLTYSTFIWTKKELIMNHKI